MTKTADNPPLTTEIDLSIEDERWHEALPDLEHLCQMTCAKTLEFAGFGQSEAEISLVFADNDFVQDLNARYRGKDKPTNVLSFPQMEPEELKSAPPHLLLGDIVIAYETIDKEAIEQNKSFRAHSLHMITHGLLHLLGHDHQDDEEAKIMESLEIRILRAFGIENPYENHTINT